VFATDWGGGRKQVQLQARGNNTDELAAYAEKALKAVESVPGAVDVGLSTKGQKPELTVNLNRGVAGSIGVTVVRSRRRCGPRSPASRRATGRTRRRDARRLRQARAGVASPRVRSASVATVIQRPGGAPTTAPLGQVASVTTGVGPAVINHLNRDKVVSVEFNTSGRSMGEVTTDALAAWRRFPSAGCHHRQGRGGAAAGRALWPDILALGVAIGLMYLILVMQFGSFIDPLAIMLSLPLSLIGVMLGLAVTGTRSTS
jgi:HAE1 family hydrophobic/amphiphilic exporter-1